MTFRISGLDPAAFAHLHALSDSDLAAAGVRRVRVEHEHAAPCRISLDDAQPGEAMLLLAHLHQAAATPYRQQGPIFVRRTMQRYDAQDTVPPALARRPLSLRGFDAAGMMIEAELCDGADMAVTIARCFANENVAYIHAHYARRGCFAALIERAA